MDFSGAISSTAGGAAIAAGALAYAVRVPSCTWLAPSVARGPGDRPAIALTFDDGPSESTDQLLEILAQFRVSATFFQCGANARRLPAVARAVTAAGHEIGNHTESHPMLALHAAKFIDRELAQAQESIEAASGIRPRYFRPPYGVRWFGLRQAQRRHNLTGVMWSTIALDWKRQAPEVVARLLQGANNGAIFCLHDGRALAHRPDISVTLQAVREIVPRLLDRGFRLETLTDLLCPTTN